METRSSRQKNTKRRYPIARTPESLETWQKVFGPDFKQPVVEAAAAPVTKTSKALDTRAPLEEFIEEKAFPRVGGYRARIECRVEKLAGFRYGPLRNLRSIGKGRKLRLKVITDVPEPFELYWKVRNRGAEAEQVGDLRGQLIPDNGTRSRVEDTKYQGRYYVEVYVVKNERVVASDHHDVVIK